MERTIHLIRHGEVANPTGVIYGRLPGFHLSDRGLRQARAAADHLASRAIGAVWSSPLERAQETADAIAAVRGLEVVTDERLIESATTLEGVGRSFVAFVTDPRVWWRIRDPLRPSWGESYSDIRLRMLEVVEEALASSAGEVTFVSHQTPVQAVRKVLARRPGPPWLRERCATGSVSTLTLDGGRVVSASYFEPGAA